jgi:hypothetical protein
LLRDEWGFKLMGTSRHGPMICVVAFTREEASKRRAPPLPFFVQSTCSDPSGGTAFVCDG